MKLTKEQLMLSELRAFPVTMIPDNDVTDSTLTAAITANEELINLGYTLSAKDIITLARCGELYEFVSRFKDALGDVKAKPMYPNFPTQVMDMDVATFRFHQVMHYFSTYGAEMFFGLNVSDGWLPSVEDTPKINDDNTLLKAKTIQLVDRYAADEFIYKRILSKCERVTEKESMLLSYAIPNVHPHIVKETSIPFKENIMPVFYEIFKSDAEGVGSETKVVMLSALCKHTGDVFKCIDYTLTRCKYHFRTAQKRVLVHLLEQYPLNDFKENIILSNKKSNRTELLLRYLDFNAYAKLPVFKTIVKELRSGELRSWMSGVETRLANRDASALEMLAKRPGIMLRSITRLLRLGYTPQLILDYILPHAGELRTQTIVSIINAFGEKLNKIYSNESNDDKTEVTNVIGICKTVLVENLKSKKTDLCDKKVFLDFSEYDIEHSVIETNDKSDEGGYIRSGISYKIPENVHRMRFFVYWNHRGRSDVDLHSSMVDASGEQYSIGWNSNFKDRVSVFSGDITHSNATEYIDIDLDAAEKNEIDIVRSSINLYSAYDASTLGELDECYVGCMGVSDLGETVKLYNPKNCFFTHNITAKSRCIDYGYIDVKNRCITVIAKPSDGTYNYSKRTDPALSIKDYLNTFLDGQGCEIVDKREDADYVLIMAKPNKDNEISLIDNNFFMDA